jgi:8-oxo-dGTP pyrophosphatase MutT (NUDIX family)
MKEWVDMLSAQGYLGAGARRQEAYMRHFGLPIFRFAHPKDAGASELAAIVNRKRLMRRGLRQFEGLVGLLGGKAEPGEDRAACLKRELGEEVGFDLDSVEQASVLDEGGFTVTWFFVKDGEALVRQLAGQCEEGVIDVILESEVKKDRYVDPKIEDVISRALLAAAAMIMESAAK